VEDYPHLRRLTTSLRSPRNLDPRPDPDTFEEVVARRVHEYVTRGQQQVLSSELIRRVAAWHDNIGPKLEAMELRKSFDIHAYGDPGREHGFKVRRAGREGLAPRAEARPEAGHGGAGHPSEGRRLKAWDCEKQAGGHRAPADLQALPGHHGVRGEPAALRVHRHRQVLRGALRQFNQMVIVCTPKKKGIITRKGGELVHQLLPQGPEVLRRH